jgi:hypothetical protein
VQPSISSSGRAHWAHLLLWSQGSMTRSLSPDCRHGAQILVKERREAHPRYWTVPEYMLRPSTIVAGVTRRKSSAWAVKQLSSIHSALASGTREIVFRRLGHSTCRWLPLGVDGTDALDDQAFVHVLGVSTVRLVPKAAREQYIRSRALRGPRSCAPIVCALGRLLCFVAVLELWLMHYLLATQ